MRPYNFLFPSYVKRREEQKSVYFSTSFIYFYRYFQSLKQSKGIQIENKYYIQDPPLVLYFSL